MVGELFLNAVHTGVDHYAVKSDKQDVREYTERRAKESFWHAISLH